MCINSYKCSDNLARTESHASKWARTTTGNGLQNQLTIELILESESHNPERKFDRSLGRQRWFSECPKWDGVKQVTSVPRASWRVVIRQWCLLWKCWRNGAGKNFFGLFSSWLETFLELKTQRRILALPPFFSSSENLKASRARDTSGSNGGRRAGT